MTTRPFFHSIVRTAIRVLRPRSIADSLTMQQHSWWLDAGAERRIQAPRERVSPDILDHHRRDPGGVLRGPHRVRGLPTLVLTDHQLPCPGAPSRRLAEARRVHPRPDREAHSLRARLHLRSTRRGDLEA